MAAACLQAVPVEPAMIRPRAQPTLVCVWLGLSCRLPMATWSKICGSWRKRPIEFGRLGLTIFADNFDLQKPQRVVDQGAWLLIAP